MNRNLRTLVLLLVFLLCLAALTGCGAKADYPSKSIDMVIASSAGSGGDTAARIIASYLGEELGVTINVINTAGGGGITAVQSVLDAQADGYTLMAEQGLSSSYQYSLDASEVPYDIIKDRTYICKIISGPQVLCGSTEMGWKDVTDVAAYLKDGGHDEFFWGGIGSNSAANFAFLQFCQAYDIDMSNLTELRYSGGGDILAAIAGGHILMGSCAASGVPSYVQSNSVVPLVVCGPARLDILPDVPCAAELGLDNLNAGFWIGISCDAATPDNVVETISAAVEELIKNEAFIADLNQVGAVIDYTPQADMAAYIEAEGKSVAELVALGE